MKENKQIGHLPPQNGHLPPRFVLSWNLMVLHGAAHAGELLGLLPASKPVVMEGVVRVEYAMMVIWPRKECQEKELFADVRSGSQMFILGWQMSDLLDFIDF